MIRGSRDSWYGLEWCGGGEGNGWGGGIPNVKEMQFKITTERMKIFLLLVILFDFSCSEKCRESDSINLIENETKRDVSFIRRKEDGSCTIKFVDSSR